MKKIRMAMMAVAALSGVGSAFALSPKSNATTYYARQTTGSNFHWTQTVPNPSTATCSPQSNEICQISTNVAPTDNLVPAGHTPTNFVYKSK
jgi:hypothetical protein